jgi:poly-gamma-glutamate capsule biosynthesis protein CapA/YwtB (metallophosphatase superfamily)
MNERLSRPDRRFFLKLSATAILGLASGRAAAERAMNADVEREVPEASGRGGQGRPIKLFLCGDVMTGRGIDQILPHPGDPRIHEAYIADARGYVKLAERANGSIPRPVDFDYIWGDALGVLTCAAPDARIINLETAVTRSDRYWPDKGINYRMSPENIGCITAAHIDCCVIANNHVLDWGYSGFADTLHALHAAGLDKTGAGLNRQQARAPAIIQAAPGSRVIVFGFGATSSGIPRTWAAAPARAGVNLLPDFSPATVRRIADHIATVKRPGDIVVASIHWGGNWGYAVPQRHRSFAHRLIDAAGVDVIHGHSSHHPRGIEVYQGKLVLYGCGDFLNDYEGIRGYEAYRGDLALMYLPALDPQSGRLTRLEMVPLQMRRFSLHHASEQDARWLAQRLSREGAGGVVGVELRDDNILELEHDVR